MKKEKTNKKFLSKPEVLIAYYTLIPIFIFAVVDVLFWTSLETRFGLNHSWYAVAIEFHTFSSTPNILYPNGAFILYVITVISLNIRYYRKLKRKNS
jgi:hypothetical protein